MNNVYAQKVELLLRIIPLIAEDECFAIHGGTAINLFLKNLPRYSVDIDLTYVPLEDRVTSLASIDRHLNAIATKARRAFKGMNIVPVPATSKLLCEYRGRQIKIEVNQTKRGIVGGHVQVLPLCDRAQEEFGMYCEARIVPTTLLYGGKVAAALSRQHPRDLFDVRYMDVPLEEIKEGFIFCLLGSDRPLHESFAPNLLDQTDAMEKQFAGMTETEFTYRQFEESRTGLIQSVNALMTDADKRFLLEFERAEPVWEGSGYEAFREYPSVRWKLLNLQKLKKQNPQKLYSEAARLQSVFGL